MGSVIKVSIKPNESLVSMLEDLLSMAKEGEIIGGAVALIHPDGTSSNRFACGDYPVRLIGEMRCLEREIIDLEVDTRAHVAGTCY